MARCPRRAGGACDVQGSKSFQIEEEILAVNNPPLTSNFISNQSNSCGYHGCRPGTLQSMGCAKSKRAADVQASAVDTKKNSEPAPTRVAPPEEEDAKVDAARRKQAERELMEAQFAEDRRKHEELMSRRETELTALERAEQEWIDSGMEEVRTGAIMTLQAAVRGKAERAKLAATEDAAMQKVLHKATAYRKSLMTPPSSAASSPAVGAPMVKRSNSFGLRAKTASRVQRAKAGNAERRRSSTGSSVPPSPMSSPGGAPSSPGTPATPAPPKSWEPSESTPAKPDEHI